MMAIGLRSRMSRVFDRRHGKRRTAAGGEADNDIFLPQMFAPHFVDAQGGGSSSASVAPARALVPPAITNCTIRELVLNVGGHSAASRAAMRPLVPAPT